MKLWSIKWIPVHLVVTPRKSINRKWIAPRVMWKYEEITNNFYLTTNIANNKGSVSKHTTLTSAKPEQTQSSGRRWCTPDLNQITVLLLALQSFKCNSVSGGCSTPISGCCLWYCSTPFTCSPGLKAAKARTTLAARRSLCLAPPRPPAPRLSRDIASVMPDLTALVYPFNCLFSGNSL